MIRIIAFIVVVVAIAALVTGLTGIEGVTQIRFAGWDISGPSWAFAMAAAIVVVLIIVTTLIVSGLWRLPKSIRRRRDLRRREKGLVALTRGLEAVAAGDAADAQRHARIASRQLHGDQQGGLTRLLTAQAAQLAGDEETAQASFASMLAAPETEFLGLRGLYLQAMASGDRKEAREYAERAFRLRPGTEWAYKSVYALHLERGAWGDARDALQRAKSHGLEDDAAAKRREAALLTAMAYAAADSQDRDTALREAEEALRKAPGFAPAAVLAAQLEAAAGRRSKAGRLLDDAWKERPHPAISRMMSELYAGESLDKQTARLNRLADQNPDTDESRLLRAEQQNRLGNFAEARDLIEPLLTRSPRARTFSAMAVAMRGLHGPEQAQVWLDRAAAAPLDPVPGADGNFHFTTDGWQRLIREFGDHGRMAPPPLEEIQTSLTMDELHLLLAPPVAAVPPAPPETGEAPDTQEESTAEATETGDAEDDSLPPVTSGDGTDTADAEAQVEPATMPRADGTEVPPVVKSS